MSEEYDAGIVKGKIIAELRNLSNSVQSMDNSFKEFKIGIGDRVENLEKDTVQMKTKMDFLMWVLARITTPILGFTGISILAVFVWHFAKK